MAKEQSDKGQSSSNKAINKPADKGPPPKVSLLEVQGCRAPLRATEFGGKPLHNGTQILVHCGVAQRLVLQYNPHLVLLEKDLDSKGLKNGHWEITKVGEGPKPRVESGESTADKSMKGRTRTR